MKRAISNLFRRRCRNSQSGTVAVEMAIVLPLFGILFLGVLEVGSMAREHQALQNAAREGARFSALVSNRMDGAQNPTAVETRIKDRIIAYLANEKVTVTASNITVNQQYPVPIGALTVLGSQIIVTYNHSFMFPGVTTYIPLGSVQLRGTAVFRNFY